MTKKSADEVGRKPRKCDALETKQRESRMSDDESWDLTIEFNCNCVCDFDKSNFEKEIGGLFVVDLRVERNSLEEFVLEGR